MFSIEKKGPIKRSLSKKYFQSTSLEVHALVQLNFYVNYMLSSHSFTLLPVFQK